jgi:hypothetical protein
MLINAILPLVMVFVAFGTKWAMRFLDKGFKCRGDKSKKKTI